MKRNNNRDSYNWSSVKTACMSAPTPIPIVVPSTAVINDSPA